MKITRTQGELTATYNDDHGPYLLTIGADWAEIYMTRSGMSFLRDVLDEFLSLDVGSNPPPDQL
jgi:hypothetical protein